ncbi:hypothetical protein QLX08_004008 [Tetragonisca angustula]|uniref:Uncharacterized protein n=1 Tax=Tetragonisca angustula TaxID=166442 RepID=A0AAW1A739_9HYME
MAIRVVRAYHRIWHETALTLAQMVPSDLITEVDSGTYPQVRRLQRSGMTMTKLQVWEMKRQAHGRVQRK